MKVLTVVGARPQFIKAAPVSRALASGGIEEVLVHTGQHYDYEMSEVFFKELEIRAPNVNLDIGSGSHAQQTGHMLIGIETVLLKERPDWVLIYGDTNSTLAGAIAASKLHIPVAHVEAGLRSFNRRMPEEINRVVADHLSSLLLCPSETAVKNLSAEGVIRGVHVVGDVMADALLFASRQTRRESNILTQLGLVEKRYLLATVHRAENTDDVERLRNILTAFARMEDTIVFPVHPRTQKKIAKLAESFDLKDLANNVRMIEPVGYSDMVLLEQAARIILTDSGGVQKEAYWLGVPCVTLRDETEWIETVQAGWNVLVGADSNLICEMVRTMAPHSHRPVLYGDGRAAIQVMQALSAAV
jgi:UDP-GlcNAc3NAcA epimerase